MQAFCLNGYRWMNMILLLIILYCSYEAFQCEEPWGYKRCILILGSIVYMGLVFQFWFWSKKLSENVRKIVLCLMFTGFGMGLIITGMSVQSARQTDLFYLHYAAVHFLEYGFLGNYDYFMKYPFQQNYTLLLVVVYKIGDLLGVYYRTAGTLFGCFLLFFTAILVYVIATRVKNRQFGMLVVFLICTNPVIYLYASYYYTSLIAMFFVAIIIYLAIKAMESETAEQYICFFLLGGATYLGMQFRSTVGIAMIAVTSSVA